jgi:hypothetical protein
MSSGLGFGSGGGVLGNVGSIIGIAGVIYGLFFAPKAQTPVPQDVQLNNYDRSKPVPIVYGTNRFAGTTFFLGNTGYQLVEQGGKGMIMSMAFSGAGGQVNEQLYYYAQFCVSFGEGNIVAITNIYINNEQIIDQDNNIYNLNWKIYLGTSDQDIDPHVNSWLSRTYPTSCKGVSGSQPDWFHGSPDYDILYYDFSRWPMGFWNGCIGSFVINKKQHFFECVDQVDSQMTIGTPMSFDIQNRDFWINTKLLNDPVNSPPVPWRNTSYVYLNGLIGPCNTVPVIKAEVAGKFAWGAKNISQEWQTLFEVTNLTKNPPYNCGHSFQGMWVGTDQTDMLTTPAQPPACFGFNGPNVEGWLVDPDNGVTQLFSYSTPPEMSNALTQWCENLGNLIHYGCTSLGKPYLVTFDPNNGFYQFVYSPDPNLLAKLSGWYDGIISDGTHLVYIYLASSPQIWLTDEFLSGFELCFCDFDLSSWRAYNKTWGMWMTILPTVYPLRGVAGPGQEGITNTHHYCTHNLWGLMLEDGCHVGQMVGHTLIDNFGLIPDGYVACDAMCILTDCYLLCVASLGWDGFNGTESFRIYKNDLKTKVAEWINPVTNTSNTFCGGHMVFWLNAIYVEITEADPTGASPTAYSRYVFEVQLEEKNQTIVTKMPNPHEGYWGWDNLWVYENYIINHWCNKDPFPPFSGSTYSFDAVDFGFQYLSVSTGTGGDANPIEVCYDFMINNRYGMGIDPSSFDGTPYDIGNNIGTWAIEYQYCNELITVSDQKVKEVRFAFSNVYDSTKKGFDLVRDILSTCRAFLYYCDGKIKVKIEKANEKAQFYFGLDEETYISLE